jgi:FtsP/CotA-like multicopper oxidase with cupredoxin domain
MLGALVASFAPGARAQTAHAVTTARTSASRTILRLQNQTININRKAASVFAIRQPDGTAGIITDAGKPFYVRVENRINEPSLIHWHGLNPPWQQDSVPGISGPPIHPGRNADCDFPLDTVMATPGRRIVIAFDANSPGTYGLPLPPSL